MYLIIVIVIIIVLFIILYFTEVLNKDLAQRISNNISNHINKHIKRIEKKEDDKDEDEDDKDEDEDEDNDDDKEKDKNKNKKITIQRIDKDSITFKNILDSLKKEQEKEKEKEKEQEKEKEKEQEPYKYDFNIINKDIISDKTFYYYFPNKWNTKNNFLIKEGNNYFIPEGILKVPKGILYKFISFNEFPDEIINSSSSFTTKGLIKYYKIKCL
jgi:hypothetical protein